jgi:hypothetical protein
MRRTLLLTVFLCSAALCPDLAFGQRVAVGGKMSTLGIGVETTAAVTKRSNVRGSFNFLNYGRDASSAGIHYDGSIAFRSVQTTYDQYLAGPFHVSPGLLLYNGNHGSAVASVPAGRMFSVGNTQYFSNPSNPINGNAELNFRKAAPIVLLGFGNPLSRGPHRFGINVDFGVVFQGEPDFRLNLTGSACTLNPTIGCLNASSDPTVVANIQREEERIRTDLEPLKYYPVLSIGIGWKF